MRAGEEVVGIFVKLAGHEVLDMVAAAGFDFAVVDFEHSQLDAGQVGRQVRYASALGLPVLARLPSVDSGAVNRLLEHGAAGIQVSSFRCAQQSTDLRSAMRYPPGGTRSVSTAQPGARYGRMPLTEYLAAAAAEPPLVVGQIETATTADPLEEILAPLDVAFVGTTDLSVDLGAPGRLDDAAVRDRMTEVASVAGRRGIPFGGFAGTAAQLAQLRADGATYLVVGSDLQALGDGLGRLLPPGKTSEGAPS